MTKNYVKGISKAEVTFITTALQLDATKKAIVDYMKAGDMEKLDALHEEYTKKSDEEIAQRKAEKEAERQAKLEALAKKAEEAKKEEEAKKNGETTGEESEKTEKKDKAPECTLTTKKDKACTLAKQGKKRVAELWFGGEDKKAYNDVWVLASVLDALDYDAGKHKVTTECNKTWKRVMFAPTELKESRKLFRAIVQYARKNNIG